MDRLKADQPIIHEPNADEPATPAENETLDAPPRAFLPITPFGDAKPFAGSFIDPTAPTDAGDEPADSPEGSPAD